MKISIFFIFSIFSINAIALDISYTPKRSINDPNEFCYHTFLIYGDIKKGDFNLITSEINKLRKQYGNTNCPQPIAPRIELDSNGGDVQEAMKIGKFIRQNNFNTQISFVRIYKKGKDFDIDVNKKGQCNSSCVFIFAGGVDKSFSPEFSEIGIHRPFFSNLDSNLTIQEIKIAREKLNKSIKDYLIEMEVNPSLADDMLGTPPEKIRYLTVNELEKYRLIGKDPNYDELETAKNAKRWNLSSSEYRKRDAIGNEKCQYLGDQKRYVEQINCWQMTILGISNDEYQKRISRAKTICNNLPDDKKNNCNRDILVLGK